MKKGLLLSLVASTMIFAGGDIAPVEPVADAPASDCKEFWGTVGVYYRTTGYSDNSVWQFNELNRDLFDLHEASVTAVLGYEGALGTTGLKFGAEVAGWTSLGMETEPDWAPRARGGVEGGELSQLYLAYAINNTAIKAGRFALPKMLSPFAWSSKRAGILDDTFEGVVVANTDVANTTLYGAYVHSIIRGDLRMHVASIGEVFAGVATPTTYTNPDDELGLFAFGFVNTSIADTTIQGVGYYIPTALLAGTISADDEAAWALFGSVTTQLNGVKVEANIGYVDASDAIMAFLGSDSTVAASARVSTKFGAVDASLAVSWINNGALPIVATQGDSNSMLYTANEVDGQLFGGETVGVLAKLSTQVGIGKLWATLGYWTAEDFRNTDAIGARIGYNFKVAGIDTTVQYRWLNQDDDTGLDATRDQIRVEAEYKF